MTINECCRREVDFAETAETAQTAAQRMGARHVGTLVVVDREHRPVGIVTDRDLALRVVGAGRDPNRVLVQEVMTPRPATISEDAGIETALALMRGRSARRLPVVDSDGQVVGIISADDVLGVLSRELRALEELVAESSPAVLARKGAIGGRS